MSGKVLIYDVLLTCYQDSKWTKKEGSTNRERGHTIERNEFYSKDMSLYTPKSQDEQD